MKTLSVFFVVISIVFLGTSIVQAQVPYTILDYGNASNISSTVTDTSVTGRGYRICFTSGNDPTLVPNAVCGKTFNRQPMPEKFLVQFRSPSWVDGVTRVVVILDRGGVEDTASVSQYTAVIWPATDWSEFMFTFPSTRGTSFSRVRFSFSFLQGYFGTRAVFMDGIRTVSSAGDTTMLDNGGILYANPATVDLGTAGTYGALAYSGITGSATINGDIGTSTASIDIAIHPTGTNWGVGGHNLLAQTDLAAALSNINGRINDDVSIGNMLGGLSIGRGVYAGGALDLVSGETLTLNGSSSDVFVIKATSLTINTNSTVALTGGTVWSNVFWYIDSSVTILSGTTFNGNILAVTSITLNVSATLINARLLVHGGAVIINSNILPVELIAFTATANRMNADLHWSTATEVNNYGFEIQRRQTADWAKVDFVAGAGTSNAPRDYSYTDNNLSAGRYTYRLKQIDRDGTFSYHGSVEIEIGSMPQAFSLSQNYPNPFNSTTMIQYGLERTAQVSLKVYNVLGLEVATLVNDRQEAGSYTVPFNTSMGTLNLSSGVYIYRLRAESFVSTKKLILMK